MLGILEFRKKRKCRTEVLPHCPRHTNRPPPEKNVALASPAHEDVLSFIFLKE